MRQFTTRTGDFVFLGVLAGGILGAVVVKDGLDWGWVIGGAFAAGWVVNELHRRHDLHQIEEEERRISQDEDL